MKVAIIGKGTSAIITTLVLLKEKHEITIFYDPQTPHINVGESTTPHIQKLIYEVLGISIHELVDTGLFSYKMGINFVNWGCGNNFHHNFIADDVGHHFETKDFNTFIHNFLEQHHLVRYISERVDFIIPENNSVKLNKYYFDFVVNCAGWESEDNYLEPIFKTVNSALLFRKQLTSENESFHTLHLATEDGWQFGLPFPKQNLLKCGYLYNNEYITEREAREKISHDVLGSFSWTPRYAKEMLVHPRIALNGNRLFFLEPLQALSLFYTYHFATYISSYLNDLTDFRKNEVNHKYLYEMWAYQLSLAYHYQFGSIHDTEFWVNSTKQASQFMKFSFNGNSQVFRQNIMSDLYRSRHVSYKELTYSKIGTFGHLDHQQLYFGMTGNSLI